jgi:hypothetical protein
VLNSGVPLNSNFLVDFPENNKKQIDSEKSYPFFAKKYVILINFRIFVQLKSSTERIKVFLMILKIVKKLVELWESE